MSLYAKFLLAIIVSFMLGMLIAPLVVQFMKKLKARQTILQYVDNHASKQGTPTMGGIIFIIAACVTTVAFTGFKSHLALVAVAVTFGYGVLGFLDDFIKIRFKQNLGLRAYQKVIGQLGIAIIVTIFCWKNPLVSSSINIPFTDKTLELGWWFIPFCLIIFLATTNSVNLTDGLDGLAASVSSINFAVFLIVLCVTIGRLEALGESFALNEIAALAYFCASMLGGVLSFLWLNSHPAKIFMGDTGSMALGAAVAVVAVLSKNSLMILIVGIMYVVSSISVIVQVLYFKATKKRVFLMSPYHHHLEYKGLKETKIVAIYTIISIIAGIVAILSIL